MKHHHDRQERRGSTSFEIGSYGQDIVCSRVPEPDQARLARLIDTAGGPAQRALFSERVLLHSSLLWVVHSSLQLQRQQAGAPEVQQ
jgi:hypothetical protein